MEKGDLVIKGEAEGVQNLVVGVLYLFVVPIIFAFLVVGGGVFVTTGCCVFRLYVPVVAGIDSVVVVLLLYMWRKEEEKVVSFAVGVVGVVVVDVTAAGIKCEDADIVHAEFLLLLFLLVML